MSLAPYASLSVRELTHKPSFGFPYAQSIARRKFAEGGIRNVTDGSLAAVLRRGKPELAHTPEAKRSGRFPAATRSLRRSANLWHFCRFTHCGNARIPCGPCRAGGQTAQICIDRSRSWAQNQTISVS